MISNNIISHDELIVHIVRIVKDTLKDAEGGHDWFHIERVWKTSLLIGQLENANIFVVQLAALLHDIADAKFHDGDEAIGPTLARKILNDSNVDHNTIEHVINIIENISFKGGHSYSDYKSLELDVVRDADRLDALGAIGIARTFNYGGFKNRKLYDPDIAPNLSMTKEEYKKSTAPTINHFYEKLLLLKDLMITKTAQDMAKNRHKFLETFLNQFYEEIYLKK